MRFLVSDALDEMPLEGELDDVGDGRVNFEFMKLDCEVGVGFLDFVDIVEADLVDIHHSSENNLDMDMSKVSSDEGGLKVEDDPILPEDVEELLMKFNLDNNEGFDNLLGGPPVPVDVSSSSEEED